MEQRGGSRDRQKADGKQQKKSLGASEDRILERPLRGFQEAAHSEPESSAKRLSTPRLGVCCEELTYKKVFSRRNSWKEQNDMMMMRRSRLQAVPLFHLSQRAQATSGRDHTVRAVPPHQARGGRLETGHHGFLSGELPSWTREEQKNKNKVVSKAWSGRALWRCLEAVLTKSVFQRVHHHLVHPERRLLRSEGTKKHFIE